MARGREKKSLERVTLKGNRGKSDLNLISIFCIKFKSEYNAEKLWLLYSSHYTWGISTLGWEGGSILTFDASLGKKAWSWPWDPSLKRKPSLLALGWKCDEFMSFHSLHHVMLSAKHSQNWAEPNVYLTINMFLLSYALLKAKPKQWPNFKSTLLDLLALFQVFVISLAHVNNVKSPLNLWSSNGRPFWIFFIIDLVIGPLSVLALEMRLEGTFGLVGVT